MTTPDNEIEPWGRVSRATHTVATPAFLSGAGAALTQSSRPTLALGCARSYGDVCLNAGNELVRMTALDRLIVADWDNGIVRAEALGGRENAGEVVVSVADEQRHEDQQVLRPLVHAQRAQGGAERPPVRPGRRGSGAGRLPCYLRRDGGRAPRA